MNKQMDIVALAINHSMELLTNQLLKLECQCTSVVMKDTVMSMVLGKLKNLFYYIWKLDKNIKEISTLTPMLFSFYLMTYIDYE